MLNSDGTQSKRIESAIPAAELERDIKGLNNGNLTQLFLVKQVYIYYLEPLFRRFNFINFTVLIVNVTVDYRICWGLL